LQEYATRLPEVIGDEVGKEQAEVLAGQLRSASAARRMMVESGVNQVELAKLEEAAGVFEAFANIVRVSPN
jgi:hypothetical protein